MNVLSRWLAPALLVGAAWAVVPGLGSAFHGPKLLVLAGGAVAATVGSLRASAAEVGGSPALALRWAAGAWGVTTLLSSYLGVAPSAEAVLRELCGAVLLLALLRAGVDRRRAAAAAAVAGTGVAAVALLQALGADPFAAAGWTTDTPGARLAVYATLGNPDFVASFLAPVLVLMAGERLAGGARWLAPAAVVVAMALVATRSLATAGALAAAGVAVLAALPGRARGRALAALGLGLGVVALAAIVVALAAGRDPGRAAAGRWYLLRVAAPHIRDAPLVGAGPGSFEVLWTGWEAGAFASGAAADADRPFAAAQDHAHADLLERALEQGLPGALAFAAVVGLAIAAAVGGARRAGDEAQALATASVAGALAALAARSLVDFPFARPADLTLLVVLAAMAGGRLAGAAGASAAAGARVSPRAGSCS